ncbi:MAG: hypothetical protein EAY81_04110 [Bacteroidetes bacterium]|nr:MAG: hypothetical protein EAY81_04110 [Bacteroidota bacterium]
MSKITNILFCVILLLLATNRTYAQQKDSIILGNKVSKVDSTKVSQLKDSLTQKYKSNILPHLININGLQLTSDVFYTQEPNIGQGGPNKYIRGGIQGDFSIAKLPFKLTGLVSTEHNSYNRINNVSVSFDYARFKDNLEQNKKPTAYDFQAQQRARSILRNQMDSLRAKSLKGRDTIGGNLNIPSTEEMLTYSSDPRMGKAILGKKISGYEEKFGNKDYQRDIEEQKAILNDVRLDTSEGAKVKLANAKHKLRQHDDAEREYEFYQQATKYIGQFDRTKQLERVRLNEVMPDSIKNKPSSLLNVLSGITKLDIGVVSVTYSPLIANGFNLKGINAEYNKNNVYTALFYGNALANYSTFFAKETLSKRGIWGGRIGYGSLNKMLFAVSFIKGQDQSSQRLEPNAKYINNVAMGAHLLYQVNKQVKLEVEYARSSKEEGINEVEGTTASKHINNIFSNKTNQSTAFYSRLYIKSKSEATKIGFNARYIDQDYFSIGTPFLRTDNMRLEGKLDQKLWKKKVGYSHTTRFDRDNLKKTKPATSYMVNSINNITWKLNRRWMFIGNYTRIYYHYAGFGIMPVINTTQLIQLTTNVNFNRKHTQHTITFTGGKVLSSSNQINNHADADSLIQPGIEQTNIGCNYVLFFNQINSSLNATLNYIITENTSRNLLSAGISYSYKIIQEKWILSHGLNYSDDIGLQRRQSILNSINSNLKGKVQIKFSHDFQLVMQDNGGVKKNNHIFLLGISILLL